MAEIVGDITQLLREWRDGRPGAEDLLFERVYSDLQKLAHFRLRGEGKHPPLQATELVNQMYLRLVAARDRDWQNRQHFFAIAARAMRFYLIDMARARPDIDLVGLEGLEQIVPAGSTRLDTAIALGVLLDELGTAHPDWCRVVELKFYLGLTDEETADVLGIKLRTMQRSWCDARRWLFERIAPGDGNYIS